MMISSPLTQFLVFFQCVFEVLKYPAVDCGRMKSFLNVILVFFLIRLETSFTEEVSVGNRSKRQSRRCPMNLCRVALNLCKPGQVCEFNTTTCTYRCVNASVPVIPYNATTSSPEKRTTYNTSSSTTSPCDLSCLHGSCRLLYHFPVCVCNAGWQGYLCDSPVVEITTHGTSLRSLSTLPITENASTVKTYQWMCGTCVHGDCIRVALGTSHLSRTFPGGFNLPGYVYQCKCHETWFGSSCNNQIIPLNTTGNGTGDAMTTSVAPFTSSSSSSSSSATPRKCRLNCIHGECKSLSLGGFAKFDRCICDQGWKGPLCNIPYESTVTAAKSRSPSLCGSCVHGDCIEISMNRTEFLALPGLPGRSYQCQCHDNWGGHDCNSECSLDCNGNGKCMVNGTKHAVCDCHDQYMPPECKELRPTTSATATAVIQVQSTPDWLWYIVTACILLLILLIVVAVVMPLYLWKHRNILILKIVYYLKPYEDDDEKKYDAFVSFKGRTEDEAFVYRTLALRLENEMNFKLCLHDRDFIPGEYISDQIIDAIDNSRRTILILSPDYCNSEWTKFEYHRAREEMLRNKTRIIPIMYKDISSIEDIDPTLNELLRSITYITWPGFASDVANKHELEAIDDKKARKEEERRQKEEERFWRKVHLTMPKKHKNSSTEPLPSDSCTVPLSPISNGKINSGFTSNDETPSVPLSDIRTSPEDLSEINVIVANGKTSKYEDVDSSSTIPSSNGFLHNNVKSIDFPLSPACEKQNGHHQNGLTISA
ncbi:uncharacterized protein LOC106167474 isoform X2 [Lingula anatina]|uniref:Uncharacterized protein LOC106167474 isoform X2 n=1 Tax=Lingula anatina TaxID=7574 RepID=A0A1S3IU41_LINAN|nr:uncharacterized protein LOC106167474 isoform X2 [Lingula anatina]|eukprot:XP_013401725.1 uncharacterized protein LOC106167474 isoform X2 [Lingula anatina]